MTRHHKQNRGQLAFAAALFGAAAVFAGSASGANTSTEAREVSGFDRVVMRSVGELTISQGASEALEIEAEPHLLPKIGSEVRDGVLYLEILAPQFNTQYPLRFRLTVKELDGLDSMASANVHIGTLRSNSLELKLTGSGDIHIDALDAAQVETHLTGAGNVSIDGGQVDRQTLQLQGSGDYATGGMTSRAARVNIAGSGNVTVHASELLEVRISGSGDVQYVGTPRIEQDISGAGNVSPAPAW